MSSFAEEKGRPGTVPVAAGQVIRQIRDHAIFLIDRQGRIASWNDGVATVFGWQEADWLGLPSAAVFTPDDVASGLPEREMRLALETGRADDDRWLQRRDGQRFFAAGTLTRIADDAGAPLGFVKIVRDATEPFRLLEERGRLLQAESQARADAERQAAALTAAIESIPDGVYIGDANGIVRCNPPALALFGASSLADLPRTPADLAREFRIRHAADGQQVRPEELPFYRALQGETAVVETWATRKSTGEDVFIRGAAAPIVVDGRIVGAVAVHSDLTGKVRLQQKEQELDRIETVLRERDEQLRAVFSGVRDYAMFTVDLEGRISSWHEGAALMKGYTAGQAIGMPFANLFTRADQEKGQPQREMDIAARTGEYKGEGTRVRANGECFDAAVVLTALRGPKDEVLGFLKLTQDITDRRRQEREREEMLRNAEAARAEAERISHAMSEFLATISHELRTPLGAILGWAHMLDRGTPDEAQFGQGLAAITRNARIQVQLIDDLLDMNRIESGQLRLGMQPLEPAGVIAKAVDAVLPSATAKRIQLRTVLDPRSSVVLADPDRLQQIVWNLLSNAVKFTLAGGAVTVSLASDEELVTIVVADTGQGIRPEFLGRMFDRFQQQDSSTTRRHGGLGIGLAIARELAELHGGTIRAESEGPGRGATFTVSLPARPRHARRVERSRRPRATGVGSEAHAEAARPKLEGISVLLVDDEKDAREVAAHALRGEGAVVETAASAEEGLSMLKRTRPAVIVADIGMPVHYGYDFMRWVRDLPEDEGGRTPAVAYTAFTRTEDRERVIAGGFHAHLSKPAEPDDLTETIARLAEISDAPGRPGPADQSR